jgi:hypothetical protein
MRVAAIREKLMIYLADANDSKVKALYTLLEDDIEESSTFALTKEHLKILDEEHKLHLSGKSKSYSLEEAKQIIRGERAM